MHLSSIATHPKAILVSTWIANIVLLMLIAEFQTNVLASSLLKITYDIVIACLIAALFLLTDKPSIRFLIAYVVLFCIGLLFSDVLKSAYLPFCFYFGYVLLRVYKERVLMLLTLLMFFNLALIGLQIVGINEIFYVQQNYYDNVGNIPFRNLFTYTKSIEFLPLTQLRPSGIFPSTIYLSYFQFFLALYYFTGDRCMGRFFYFFLSLLFVLTGSTASMLLAIFIYLFGEDRLVSRRFLYTYIISLILYYVLLPSYFFHYNYSLQDLFLSISSRYFLESTTGAGGLSGSFLLLLSLLIGIVLIADFYIKAQVFRSLAFVSVLLVSPIIVHNAAASPFYWFYVGSVIGCYSISRSINYREIGSKMADYFNVRKRFSEGFIPKK